MARWIIAATENLKITPVDRDAGVSVFGRGRMKSSDSDSESVDDVTSGSEVVLRNTAPGCRRPLSASETSGCIETQALRMYALMPAQDAILRLYILSVNGMSRQRVPPPLQVFNPLPLR